MQEVYTQQINWAKSNKKSIDKTFKKIANRKDADKIINGLHTDVFEETNCLACANCCKTTGPLLTNRDISRLSNRLKLKESEFIDQYLKLDDDNDFVFKSMPCPFLGADNYCFVYEDRPKACREFPHTDQKGQLNIAHLTRKNARICPAVASIFQKLQKIN